MNKLRVLLEELLPFYFLVMMFVIMFTDHIPTMFELYLVYAFAFAVSIFNNHLYSRNQKLDVTSVEASGMVRILEAENKILKEAIRRQEEGEQ